MRLDTNIAGMTHPIGQASRVLSPLRAIGIVALAALASCSTCRKEAVGEKVRADPASLASTAASLTPAPGVVRVEYDGRAIELRRGIAMLAEDGVSIALFTGSFEMPGCEVLSDAADVGAMLTLILPEGPDAAFFTGQTTGTYGAWAPDPHDGSRVTQLGGWLLRLDIGPFSPKVGEKIHGTIRFDAKVRDEHQDAPAPPQRLVIAGEFEVVICHPTAFRDLLPGLPSTSPSAPFSGTLAGRPFVGKSALAIVEPDPDNATAAVDEILVFARPDATCMNDVAPDVRLHTLGGAGGKEPLLGTPQPASADLGLVGGGSWTNAWARYRSLDLSPGATVGLDAVVAIAGPPVGATGMGAPATNLAGTIAAKVCVRAAPPSASTGTTQPLPLRLR